MRSIVDTLYCLVVQGVLEAIVRNPIQVLYVCQLVGILLKNRGSTNYRTVEYSRVEYSTLQYSTAQYSTVEYSTVQYRAVQ